MMRIITCLLFATQMAIPSFRTSQHPVTAAGEGTKKCVNFVCCTTPSSRQMSMPKRVEPEHGDHHSPGLPGPRTAQKQHAGVARAGRGASAASVRPPSERGTEGLRLGAASLRPGHLRGIGARTGDLEGP